MAIKNAIITYYELLFSKVSGNKDYVFLPTKQQEKQIDNFVLLLNSKVGAMAIDRFFIFDFMCFQFNLRKDQRTRFGRGVVMLNHVIGKKAFELWVNRGDSWKFYVERFIKEYCIDRPVVEEKVRDFDILQEGEERVKAMFFNQDKGLEVCVNNTTLYNPRSKLCCGCVFMEECKKVQAEIYPDIYFRRKGIH